MPHLNQVYSFCIEQSNKTNKKNQESKYQWFESAFSTTYLCKVSNFCFDYRIWSLILMENFN